MIHFEQLCDTVAQWHKDRNLVDGSTDRKQLDKLAEEFLELVVSCATGGDVRDDIGDMLVVLVNIAERHNTSLFECMELAYSDIKDRKGRMVNGKFVKEGDL